MSLDNDFKNKFKDISGLYMDKLTTALSAAFNTPELHYCRAVLHSYYFAYPKVEFRKEVALRNLLTFFEGRVINVSSPKITSFDLVQKEPLPTDLFPEGQLETYVSNWNDFFHLIELTFYESLPVMKDLSFFDDRLARNPREKFLSTPKLIVDGNGNFFESKYSFFHIANTLSYYEGLFELYYPEYPLLLEFSTKKVKRYGRRIGNGLFVGFSVNYSLLTTELKYTYLEFPHLSFEVFSEDLGRHPEKSNHFFNAKEGVLEKIDVVYFMGHFIDERIGNSSKSSKYLQNRMHFYFAVNSFYTKIYLDYVVSVIMAM